MTSLLMKNVLTCEDSDIVRVVYDNANKSDDPRLQRIVEVISERVPAGLISDCVQRRLVVLSPPLPWLVLAGFVSLLSADGQVWFDGD